MPYSEIFDGKVLDYKFLPSVRVKDRYVFYIGEIIVGTIFKINKSSWTAVYIHPCEVCPVHGFNSRMSAAEFLLTLWRLDYKPD